MIQRAEGRTRSLINRSSEAAGELRKAIGAEDTVLGCFTLMICEKDLVVPP
jgi:hypothetical protein